MTILASLVALLKDTGWRDVNLTGTAGLTSGHLYLRRKADKVRVQVVWVATGASPDLVGLIPVGFRPKSLNGANFVAPATDGTLGVKVAISSAGEVTVVYTTGQTPPSSSHLTFTAEYETADTFPVAPFPGVAA